MQPPAFSAMRADGAIEGWEPYTPAPRAPATAYRLVPDPQDPTRTVLRADAQASMSGWVWVGRVDLQRTPILQWRWRVQAPVAQADLRTRDGDDYAARVYVLFDVPRETLPWSTRAQLRLAEAVSGQTLPTAAINYVWDNQAPVGTVVPNAYTERARMWVLQSGAERAGQWVQESRDLRRDFERAFGGVAPDVVGLALATDTDNTGGQATAWFGDLRFLPAP